MGLATLAQVLIRKVASLKDRALSTILSDINKLKKQAQKQKLQAVIRLNGTSDIEWENIKVTGDYTIFNLFPELQFYDYTKNPNRKNLPSNYDLTFS